jgi:hypothetical protein
MAVVPSLAAMAALTLFQNPHTQPEGYSVDYSDWRSPATVIQRSWRRRGVLHRAATRINALLRAFSVRCFIVGINARNNLRGFGMRDLRGYHGERITLTDNLMNANSLRGGRGYLGRRRGVFQLGPSNPNLVLFQVGAAP